MAATAGSLISARSNIWVAGKRSTVSARRGTATAGRWEEAAGGCVGWLEAVLRARANALLPSAYSSVGINSIEEQECPAYFHMPGTP